MKKIALMSVADINNYGDIMFPLVMRFEIQKRIPSVEFRFFTPTSRTFCGELFYEYTKQNMLEYAPDAIIAAGGEVIHKYDDSVWQRMYKKINFKPSNTFFDWLDLKCFKSWFSVGALYSNDINLQVNKKELDCLDSVSVRGILSKKILEHNQLLEINDKITLSPDIGWVFSRYIKAINDHKKITEGLSNYVCFSVNETTISTEELASAINTLYLFAKQNQKQIIIFDFACSYSSLKNVIMENILDKKDVVKYLGELEALEIAELLMGCDFYVGSSLHCAVTVLSQSKPAAIIHKKAMTKMQDLFGHMMFTDLFSTSWGQLDSLLRRLMCFSVEEQLVLSNYVVFMQSMFDYRLNQLLTKIMERK